MIKIDLDKLGTELEVLTDFLSLKLSHSEIDNLLNKAGITIVARQSESSSLGYVQGTNKKDKLYSSFAKSINETQSVDKIIKVLESIYNHSRYIGNTSKYNEDIIEINNRLIMLGIEFNDFGKIVQTSKPKTIDEIEERFNLLNDEIEKRKLHYQVKKYCKREYLVKDYFHSLHEAIKGVLERIRELTGSTKDGYELLDQVLSHKNPVLIINKLSDENDKNEQKGFKRIIEGLVSMFRNPTSHLPRIKYNEDFNITIEVLGTVSMIHRYLDNCHVITTV